MQNDSINAITLTETKELVKKALIRVGGIRSADSWIGLDDFGNICYHYSYKGGAGAPSLTQIVVDPEILDLVVPWSEVLERIETALIEEKEDLEKELAKTTEYLSLLNSCSDGLDWKKLMLGGGSSASD